MGFITHLQLLITVSCVFLSFFSLLRCAGIHGSCLIVLLPLPHTLRLQFSWLTQHVEAKMGDIRESVANGQNGHNEDTELRLSKRPRLQEQKEVTNKVTVVLGAQWGDEGKGKVVDMLAGDVDIVARCQVNTPLLSNFPG